MGDAPYKDESWIPYRWCVRNNIAIAANAKNNSAWHIDITQNGKTTTSPESFGKNEIWQKIFEYSKYYYDKYKE